MLFHLNSSAFLLTFESDLSQGEMAEPLPGENSG